MNAQAGKLLSQVDDPSDLKKLNEKQLPELCREIREFILDETSHNPGHLGASLGAVELSVAIHYVFNTPYDKVIWDVGHQAYAHKILTGRRDQFHTNRKKGGISGFPKMAESEYFEGFDETQYEDEVKERWGNTTQYAESQRKWSSYTKEEKDAITFVKQKLDSAKWFIDAIRQRQNTMLLTMNAILEYQREYFYEGDETRMRPMILKDIADMTGLDISTISRVVNSKYIQTHFGIYALKYFFSDGMQTDSVEEVSTR